MSRRLALASADEVRNTRRPSSPVASPRARFTATNAASTIYDFTLKKLGGGTRDAPTEGADLPLSQYKGKVVLVNNVATM